MKIKLGFTLMRVNDDERNAGLENPWQEAPAMQFPQEAQAASPPANQEPQGEVGA